MSAPESDVTLQIWNFPVLTALVKVRSVSFAPPPNGASTVTGLVPETIRLSPVGPVPVPDPREKFVDGASAPVAVPAGSTISGEHFPASTVTLIEPFTVKVTG